VPPEAAHIEAANQSITAKEGVRGSSLEFLLPMALLALSTWYFDYDFLMGLYLTLAVYIALIAIRRTLTVEETYNAVLDGFKTMIEPLAALVAAYLLDEINTRLDLSAWVIDTISPYMTAQMLPTAVFLSMGADMTLVIGATLSASTFGSHACFYTDATVLTAQATGTTPFQHAITQLPYALIAAGIALVGYLLLAWF
jgi:Na+/H+ antiporter NhaC